MEKFKYGDFNPETTDELVFNGTYTDPSNETETRKQLSQPLNEVKNYLNNAVIENTSNSEIVYQFGMANDRTIKYRTGPTDNWKDTQSAGHTIIVENEGEERTMPQRLNLKFEGVSAEDLNGTTVIHNLKGERGYTGPKGDKGDRGDTGPQGPIGESFKILGRYDTLLDLETIVTDPLQGDAYAVGTAEPYEIYIYSSGTGWQALGPYVGTFATVQALRSAYPSGTSGYFRVGTGYPYAVYHYNIRNWVTFQSIYANYSSLSALIADHPSGGAGECYTVGTMIYEFNQFADDGWVSIGSLQIGPAGPKGDRGDKGETGEKGDDGRSFIILGHVTDPDDLPDPYSGEIGDAYSTGDNMEIYIWDGTGWEDVGQMQGPQGIQGEGVPSGGLTGQVLTKASDETGDCDWVSMPVDQTFDSSSENAQSGVAISAELLALKQTIIDAIYPVDSIYITVKSGNPSTYLGGTWTRIEYDAYLKIVTSNANELHGTTDHKIKVANLPSHTHTYSVYADTVNCQAGSGETARTALASGYGTRTWTSNATGSGTAYYPGYYGVYVWRRTA